MDNVIFKPIGIQYIVISVLEILWLRSAYEIVQRSEEIGVSA